ncbi:hypothetical protein, partial [Brevibacillus agri]|uniref:hypothetical protein n=3 Tax=Brevibacillus agri TaxID=51101 RepID=UPI002E1D462D|nr:hypothetical protein [Brevibacillus agri]
NKVCYWFKAGKSLMIDSSTLSLFSFQRAFSSTNRSKATFRSYHITLCFARGFSTILLYSAATRSNITKSPVLSQDFLSLFLR